MPVVRLAIGKAEPGKVVQLKRLSEELNAWLAKQPGNLAALSFESATDPNEIGRITIWENHRDADHAATLDHTVALRARIHDSILPGHQEAFYTITGSTIDFTALKRKG